MTDVVCTPWLIYRNRMGASLYGMVWVIWVGRHTAHFPRHSKRCFGFFTWLFGSWLSEHIFASGHRNIAIVRPSREPASLHHNITACRWRQAIIIIISKLTHQYLVSIKRKFNRTIYFTLSSTYFYLIRNAWFISFNEKSKATGWYDGCAFAATAPFIYGGFCGYMYYTSMKMIEE